MAGDRDDFVEIEAEEGVRPRASFADRLLIVVAGLVLAGGGLLALGNVLTDGPEAARASAAPTTGSSSPTARPSRSPRPTPAPRVVTLGPMPDNPWLDTEQREIFQGWIRTRAEVPAFAKPGGSTTPAEMLPAGYVGHASYYPGSVPDAPPGWLSIDTAPSAAWIDASDPGLVERFGEPWLASTFTEIGGVAAGETGFVAWGTGPAGSVQLFSSADGATWRAADTELLRGGFLVGVAYGPAGWLAAGSIPGGARGSAFGGQVEGLWRSADGITWTPLGAFDEGIVGVATLLGSSRGYLLMTASGVTEIWSSPDGVTWHEQHLPQVPSGSGLWSAIGVADGFVFVDSDRESALFSRDGIAWLPGDAGPHSDRVRVVEQWDGLLAVDEDPQGVARTWRGIIGPRAVTWQRHPELDAAPTGTRLTALASHGEEAIGFGWNTATGEPVAWRMTATGWRPEAIPAGQLGSVPKLAVGGPAGLVTVAYDPALSGSSPVFWHRDEGGWAREATPVVPPQPDPATRPCPPLPTDVLEFMTLDTPQVVACRGSAPMTFRAFAADCPGCWSPAPGDVYEPEWLASYGSALGVSPLETQQWFGPPLALAPPLTADAAWRGREIVITGHFDDPVAGDCRWLPGPESEPWRLSTQETVNACRLRFVVTAVELAR